jgi:ribonuclease R
MKSRPKIRFGVSGQSNPLKRPEQDKTHSPSRKGFSTDRTNESNDRGDRAKHRGKPAKGFADLSEKSWQKPEKKIWSREENREKANSSNPNNKNYSAYNRNSKRTNRASGPETLVTGSVKRHPDGYGFLIPDNSDLPDVYVGKGSMNGVMTNDKIEVQIQREGDRYRGELTRVVSRETKTVSGVIETRGPINGVIRDVSFAWGEDLKVTVPEGLKVKNGDWVTARILTYPEHMRGFQGEVEAVIGDLADAKNDNLRVLAAAGIPHVFTKETLREAELIPDHVTDADRAGRVDLRNKNFITIDGKTAKDFDDAIYIEKNRRGFKLWVAIADVSHYVRPGTAIDDDAYERGTSTYFPNFVSPMLPEALSNEICSLKPKVDRLALVCEMDIDFEGTTYASSFYEGVINSQSRVTYGEAQEIIDGGKIEKHAHVANDIRLASELAHILMDRRFRNGSLNLEVPETMIEIDESGVPVDIIRSERLFAHRLIEEMMLAANVATAQFLDSKRVPALYRIHDSPKPDAITILEGYLENFGYSKTLAGQNMQKKLTAALQEFAGKPEEIILNILTLRSMMQAKYSPENIGHFGLGFTHYAHFTSPIRRYPDLIIHRLVKSVVNTQGGYLKVSEEDLQAAGSMLSACEQRSVKAERQITSIKKARFVQKHLGEEFDGIISSVTKFGVFVLLRQFDVDGLVKVEELGHGLHFDEAQLRLTNRRTGMSYGIGDKIRIQIAATDIQSGKIDFVVATGEEGSHARLNLQKKKNQPAQKRGSSQDDRERVRETRFSRSSGKNKTESVRDGGRKDGRKNSRKNSRKNRK